MSDDNKPVYGLKRVNARGDQEMTIRFSEGFDGSADDLAALKETASGAHGRLVITGQYVPGREAFIAERVNFLPSVDENAIDEIRCPLVVEALKVHLKHGDPNEAIFHSGKAGNLTAQRVLELLLAKDPRVLRFVEDVHGAALRTVRVRKRDPMRGPKR